MSAERLEESKSGELIQFRRKGKTNKSNIAKMPKLKKDGTPKMTPCNSPEGDPKTVYPIKNKQDIENIKQYFLTKSKESANNEDKKIYARYAMLWVVGINTGRRMSDIVKLKWGDIFYDEREYKTEGNRIKEKKTGKYKTIFLNKYAREAIDNYIDEFKPCLDSDHFIFKSRETNSKNPYIQVQTVGKALQKAAGECNIKVNVNTHTVRKSFGYHWYMGHIGDLDALVHLQKLFNHSSPKVTLTYIGMEDEQSEKYFNDLEW